MSHSLGVGSPSTQGSCTNCKTQASKGILSCAQGPLTIQLLHHTFDGLKDHLKDDFNYIEKYLDLHLRWKIVGIGGVEIDRDDLEKFSKTEITVCEKLANLGMWELLKSSRTSFGLS